jgi:hypothetical protein
MDTITKIINAFPLLNLEWLVKGEGNIRIRNTKQYRLIEEPAENIFKRSSFFMILILLLDFPIENNAQSFARFISSSFFKGCGYVVRASGQSMAKFICHGDAIGLIKVKNWKDFSFWRDLCNCNN